MKKKYPIFTLFAFTAVPALLAQVTWDGGAGNSDYKTAANWVGDVEPTSTDDVVVDDDTELRGAVGSGWILDMNGGNCQFQSLTLDPVWTGGFAGKVGIRGSGVVDMFGDLAFTSAFTDGSSAAIASSSGGNLVVRSRGSHAIINNGSATVWVQGAGGVNDRSVSFQGVGGSETVQFGGMGDFLLGNDLLVASNLEHIWTTDTFSGTLTINNAGDDANDVNWMDPSTDVRLQGGTLTLAASDQIGDATNLAINDGDNNGATINAQGISDTAQDLALLGSGSGTYTLNVDGTTALTFREFSQNTYTGNALNISGWVEGNSSIRFTALGGTAYDGLVGEGVYWEDLTVSGAAAYLTEVSPGVWGVTTAEPAALDILNGTYSLLGDNLIGDSRAVTLNLGSMNLNGFTDTAGTLELADSSTIDLSSGGSIAFADSSGQAWSGTLTVTGALGSTSIRFGTDANGLTSDQLRSIRIGSDFARLDSNGYLRRLIASEEEVSGDNSGLDYQLVGGGRLVGTGTIGPLTLRPLAGLAPGETGNPRVTLNVNGDFSAELSAVFEVGVIRSAGLIDSDRIAATGTVDFYGTVDLYLEGEALQAGDEITVLTGTVTMPTFRDVPAQVVVDPASSTTLPSGLELQVVYYDDKITVLARNAPAQNIARNGEFDQGLFFWETPSDGGASVIYSIDDTVPDSGPTCLRADIGSNGTGWPNALLYQHFRVENGQQYTVSFRYRVSGTNPGASGFELAALLRNSQLSRDFANPAIGTFGPQGINAPAVDTWYDYSRTFTAGATDAACFQIGLGLAATGTSIYIDDFKIETTGPYPVEPANFTVLGYLPAYRFGGTNLVETNPEYFRNLDTLVYGFIMTDANGGLLEYYQQTGGGTQWNYTQDIEDTLQQLKSDYGFELFVALGGGETDETVFFADVLSDSGKRATLINNLIAFCNAENFDGVDLDYEYAAAGTNQQEDYELFVEEAKAAFAGAKTGGGDLILTAAVDTFARAYYPPDAYTAHRSNHMMNYAKDYDDHMVNIMELFNAGAPMDRIYPGITWAGKSSIDSSLTAYRNIVASYSPVRHQDTAGEWIFDGIDSVRQKIQLARALGCGGVMIWELGHDTDDAAQSLIINALEDADDDALLDEWEDDFSGGLNLRPLQDDDRDGLWNLWENLTNTNPLDGGSQEAPVSSVIGNNFEINFPYVNPERFDLFAEWSDDLTDSESWVAVEDGVNATITPDAANGTYKIQLTQPVGAQPAFIRVGTTVE